MTYSKIQRTHLKETKKCFLIGTLISFGDLSETFTRYVKSDKKEQKWFETKCTQSKIAKKKYYYENLKQPICIGKTIIWRMQWREKKQCCYSNRLIVLVNHTQNSSSLKNMKHEKTTRLISVFLLSLFAVFHFIFI